MAITITPAQVAVAIRTATNENDVPPAVTSVLAFLVPAASAIVLDYAPLAPDAVHDAALIRLAGWLYDSDPADPAVGRAMQVSGAAALLSRWRAHRAGAVGAVAGEPVPIPTPAGLPTPPAEGHFILTVTNGVLGWVAFPVPPQP
ncbi:MAG: hypothetical protein OXJ90_08850 [Spirochaetaceae bacterium]|nr:hypothetical protein [Spirochaetaceae bacterium]